MEKGSCNHAHVRLNMLPWSNSSSHAQCPFLCGTPRATLDPWLSNTREPDPDLMITIWSRVYSTSRFRLHTPCNKLDTGAGMNKHTGRHKTTPRKRTRLVWSLNLSTVAEVSPKIHGYAFTQQVNKPLTPAICPPANMSWVWGNTLCWTEVERPLESSDLDW